MLSLGTSIRTKYRAGIKEGKLNDNHWHRIQVIRTLWDLSVKIDDADAVDPGVLDSDGNRQRLNPLQLTGDGRSRLNIDLPMFVGSFWRFPTYRKGYVGCMKGFVSINMSLERICRRVHQRVSFNYQVFLF